MILALILAIYFGGGMIISFIYGTVRPRGADDILMGILLAVWPLVFFAGLIILPFWLSYQVGIHIRDYRG